MNKRGRHLKRRRDWKQKLKEGKEKKLTDSHSLMSNLMKSKQPDRMH
jgi:hypothetical protein